MIDTLTEIIREYTGDDTIVLTEDTQLQADLGLNSFDLVSLAVEVEDRLDLEIPDRMIKEFRTVKDVLAFIEAQ